MEQEDNARFENILQIASGDGVHDHQVSGMVEGDEIGSHMGGKLDEHDEHDEGEWKYKREEHQSEKQQQQILKKAAIEGEDVMEGIGNGHGIQANDENMFLGQEEVGNGVTGFDVDVSAVVGADYVPAAAGIYENEEGEVEIIKNDGDFSTTSNTTSTTGEDAEIDVGMLQVEMKIEAANTPHLFTEHTENMETHPLNSAGTGAETEEEEPSSLATNTTNGTNSLSENAPHLLQPMHGENEPFGGNFSIQDKENIDPSAMAVDNAAESAHPIDLDFDSHSFLNPNATEFVPNFGSNPASPTSTEPQSGIAAFDVEEHVGEPACETNSIESQQQPHPNALPRHLLGGKDDDFVAHSPQKGREDTYLESIVIPGALEFEHEAAKRPHELEAEDDLIGDVTGSYMDNGPETSVDPVADVEMLNKSDEKLTQEVSAKNSESIENLLNTVQLLPIESESLNNSIVEEASLQQEDAAGKELLNMEEKENISHSPSTEEMQMNIQNDLHASAKDIPQIPIDMDSAACMNESFYMEHTSTEIPQIPEEKNSEEQINSEQPINSEINISHDEINVEEMRANHNEINVEEMRANPFAALEAKLENEINAANSLNIFAPEFRPTPKQDENAADALTPSPLSTEEKHLMEETKEQAPSNNILDELEKKMDDTIQSTGDGFLSQIEEVDNTATHILDNYNPFAPESEVQMTVPVAVNAPQDHKLHFDQNEQFAKSERASESFKVDFLSSQPDVNNTFTNDHALNDNIAAEPVFTWSLAAEPNLVPATDNQWTGLPIHNNLQEVQPSIDLPAEKSVGVEIEPVEPIVEAAAAAAEEAAPQESFTSDIVPVVAAVNAVAITAAAVAATEKASTKKPTARTSLSAKPKVGDVKKAPEPLKKSLEAAKKPSRPTTAPAKPVVEKKHLTGTATARLPTTAAKKPPTTTKAATTTRPSTAPAAAKTSVTKASASSPIGAKTLGTARSSTSSSGATKTTAPSKPATSTRLNITTSSTLRKSAPASTTTSTAPTKPKTAANAPTKPTTLGISSSANKVKVSSPRSTLTSQIGKTGPSTTAAPIKSPMKTTATNLNGTGPTTTSTTKTVTKTFTARPAPKTTHTTVTTIHTIRRNIGGTTSTNTVTKTNASTALKKTPPNTKSTVGTKSASPPSKTPTKTPTTASKLKTKEITKKITPTKTANAQNKIQQETKMNGVTAVKQELDKGKENLSEQQPQLNGGEVTAEKLENGTHHDHFGNIEGFQLEQNASLNDA